MSNWMTSGSARLKAKQNASFSRRARKRAAVVAPTGPMMRVIARTQRFRQAKPRQNKGKWSSMYGNPITRRGVAVSIGTAGTCNQHCDDDPIDSNHPGYITAEKKYQSLNKSSSVSSTTYKSCDLVNVIPSRRIWDKSSKYSPCSSNRKRPANQIVGSNYHYRQYIASDVGHVTDTQERSNRALYQHQDSPIQNNHASNGVYDDTTQKVPCRSLRPDISRKNFVTQNSADQFLLSNDFRRSGFKSGSQTPDGSQQQETFGSMMGQNLDHAQFLFDNRSFQKGIQRFQKRKKHHPDLTLAAEEIKEDSFYQRNDDSWEDMNNDGQDDALELKRRCSASSGSGATFLIESKEQWQPRQRQRRQHIFEYVDSNYLTCWNQHEHENSFEESHVEQMTTQLQSIEAISENTSTYRLCDITNELDSTRGLYSPSNYTGISKFKQKTKENNNMKLDQSFRGRHVQSDKTTFEYSTLSDDIDSLYPYPVYPDENGDQLKSSMLSLRFFNDQHEIDISGNPLNT